MKPFINFPKSRKKNIKFVLTDIDDTLTFNGRLPAIAFSSLEKLWKAKIKVIPITGRPAGWCDHIARMWPVHGIVGENGAFCFYYDTHKRKMRRLYFKDASRRKSDMEKLKKIGHEILEKIPGCKISADQAYRESDLAIDFCEDVAPLKKQDIEKIVGIFKKSGATAKISSIHVNGWFGNYDKLAMTKIFFKERFCKNIENIKDNIIFTGDSPNDSPMFKFFPNSVGVANIKKFAGEMEFLPAWVTEKQGGYGFSQMVDILTGHGEPCP